MKISLIKQVAFLGVFIFFSSFSSFSFEVMPNDDLSWYKTNQDNTILIKKIKNRIASLQSQKKRLIVLKKWTDAREKGYIKQIKKLEKGLEKLGYKEQKELSFKEKIKKLQKQLKYLNNNKTNLKNRNNWSKEDEKTYQKKATVFIDSIIKLRRIKSSEE